MAIKNVSFDIEENLLVDFENLLQDKGVTKSMFFVAAIKNALSKSEDEIDFRDIILSMKHTKYNENGEAVISSDDEWLEETEWNEIFEEMTKQNRRQ